MSGRELWAKAYCCVRQHRRDVRRHGLPPFADGTPHAVKAVALHAACAARRGDVLRGGVGVRRYAYAAGLGMEFMLFRTVATQPWCAMGVAR